MFSLFIFIFSHFVCARSTLVPEVKSAAMLYRHGVSSTSGVIAPEKAPLLAVFEKHNILAEDLEHLESKDDQIELPALDKFDEWLKNPSRNITIPLIFQTTGIHCGES